MGLRGSWWGLEGQAGSVSSLRLLPGQHRDTSCSQSLGVLVGHMQGHSWQRWGRGWLCRGVLSVQETLVGALLATLVVSWAVTGAEVMTLAPAPASHPGE